MPVYMFFSIFPHTRPLIYIHIYAWVLVRIILEPEFFKRKTCLWCAYIHTYIGLVPAPAALPVHVQTFKVVRGLCAEVLDRKMRRLMMWHRIVSSLMCIVLGHEMCTYVCIYVYIVTIPDRLARGAWWCSSLPSEMNWTEIYSHPVRKSQRKKPILRLSLNFQQTTEHEIQESETTWLMM